MLEREGRLSRGVEVGAIAEGRGRGKLRRWEAVTDNDSESLAT